MCIKQSMLANKNACEVHNRGMILRKLEVVGYVFSPSMDFCVITAQPMSSWNIHRFGLTEVCKQEVMFLRVDGLYDGFKHNQSTIRPKESSKEQVMGSICELKNTIERAGSNCFIISLIGSINQENAQVYNLLQSYKERVCVVMTSCFPREWRDGSRPLFRAMTKIKRERSILGTARKITWLVSRKLFFNQKLAGDSFSVGYAVLAGKEAANYAGRLIDKDTIIRTRRSNDAALMAGINREEFKFLGRFAVFLDQDILEHPDLELTKIQFEDPDRYYPEIKRFLLNVETEYGLRVIVSAHPRSDISRVANRFKEFIVIQNKTAELIASSEFCMTHTSTAVSFAVLCNKPIMILTSNRQNSTNYDISILADWLGKIPINISQPFEVRDLKREASINRSMYAGFDDNFLSSDCGPEFGYIEMRESYISCKRGCNEN